MFPYNFTIDRHTLDYSFTPQEGGKFACCISDLSGNIYQWFGQTSFERLLNRFWITANNTAHEVFDLWMHEGKLLVSNRIIWSSHVEGD